MPSSSLLSAAISPGIQKRGHPHDDPCQLRSYGHHLCQPDDLLCHHGLVILSALNKAGIPTNSFLAAFGAFGLAVGLALQSNLSNFASGLLILIFKPFKAGDWVSIGGVEGSIKGIQMLNTAVITKDNKTVFIPNSIITSNQVINSSYQDERYISFFSISAMTERPSQGNRHPEDIFHSDKRILNADTMEIGIKEFADNSVRIAAFPKVANNLAFFV
jgi:small conductance mechanosensitive channel